METDYLVVGVYKVSAHRQMLMEVDLQAGKVDVG